VCASLPVRTRNNTVVHYFKVLDSNYRNFDLVACMKLAFMVVDISQRRDPPNELIVIMDMKGVGFMHLTCLKIGAIKKFLEFLQEAMPLRIQSVHILNTNYLFDKILAIARAFIRSELMSVIKTHPPNMDMETFYCECVPASCLPEEYGGELPSGEELNRRAIEQFRELKPFFEAEEKLRSFYKP
ncbi:alpha-tocopherol transfer protein-like, partial [Asbolus verrucosus]